MEKRTNPHREAFSVWTILKAGRQNKALSLLVDVILVCSCSLPRTLVGTVSYDHEHRECTRVACFCCNMCWSQMSFITEHDTLHLYGNRSDTAIDGGSGRYDTTVTLVKGTNLFCKGKECANFGCFPFLSGEKYVMYGRFLRPNRADDRNKFLIKRWSKY